MGDKKKSAIWAIMVVVVILIIGGVSYNLSSCGKVATNNAIERYLLQQYDDKSNLGGTLILTAMSLHMKGDFYIKVQTIVNDEYYTYTEEKPYIDRYDKTRINTTSAKFNSTLDINSEGKVLGIKFERYI